MRNKRHRQISSVRTLVILQRTSFRKTGTTSRKQPISMMTANKTVSSIKKITAGQLTGVPMTLYFVLVLLGIGGNAMVILVVGNSVVRESGGGRNSDIILVNMALSNLLVSVMRNLMLVTMDFGLEVSSSKDWCQFMMGIWVWLRAANVWSTLFLSVFHFYTLKRTGPSITSLNQSRGPSKILIMCCSLIWTVNFFFSVPAFIYSTNGDKNASETLMLVSSTTRPLLGCLWDFSSATSGLIFATTSMVIHEIIPIILMSTTNLGSLFILYTHGNAHRTANKGQDAPVIRRVPAERRAAKVILALIVLFIISWGVNVISVNYFNYNRGTASADLLVIARFFNCAFTAFSPIVLAIGHRKIREFMKSIVK
ncbi:olfactory receptor class A-like protein 4 [Clarias gariepinus]|uniref:olfactory receptor class A-like protein 4 n=1 Tax=Clarias gariepinus TaxID=13013 RepID=UPI00234CDEB4|nr:olfactory receptor class A-like protein 4 [Clarias gariepinus]